MSRRFSVNGDNNGDDNGVSQTQRREKTNNNKRKKRKRKPLLDDDDGWCIYKRGLKRAKKAVLSPFNKLFKRYTRRSSSSSPSNSSLPSNNNNNKTRKVGGYFCCLCMSKQPQTVDISSDDIDPNDPKVSYEYLKSLLEKNDFYSRECNTHLVD